MDDLDAICASPQLSPASDQASRNIIGLQFEIRIMFMTSFSQAFRLIILERVPHLSFQSKKSFRHDKMYLEQNIAANPKHTAYVSAASREMKIMYVQCINFVMALSF
jgi:hypothetical protein